MWPLTGRAVDDQRFWTQSVSDTTRTSCDSLEDIWTCVYVNYFSFAGAATLVHHAVTPEGNSHTQTPAVPSRLTSDHDGFRPPAETLKVSVWPPGPNFYVGECVLLHCTLESNSSFVWSYKWFRHLPRRAADPNARHMLSGDSYSITAVWREDAGSYWCQAERRGGNNSSAVLLSPPAELVVLGKRVPVHRTHKFPKDFHVSVFY